MFNIVIFGAPGSGKGTQSELICKNCNLEHLSTGDVLRREVANKTPLGKLAALYINKGELVPDEIILEMLGSSIDTLKGANGVVFDGFPRTVWQAEALDRILAARKTEIAIMLDLQVDDDELTKRLLERGKTSRRLDDNETTIPKRLKIYHDKTAPLAEYYNRQGKHAAIQGLGQIDEVYNRIAKILDGRI